MFNLGTNTGQVRALGRKSTKYRKQNKKKISNQLCHCNRSSTGKKTMFLMKDRTRRGENICKPYIWLKLMSEKDKELKEYM